MGNLALDTSLLIIGEELAEVDLNDLHRALDLVVLAHEIEVHRIAGHVEHTGIAAFGDLHYDSCLLVDGHSLTGDAVRPEDDPFPVCGPLVMGLIDLGISGARLAGEEDKLGSVFGSLMTFFSEGKVLPIWADIVAEERSIATVIAKTE